ncbi:YfgM family protein [Thiothrix lacustris]|uniref:Ancillary SecYEG translocon subunit n=1 Tax=Thiothrix lacustris TaxID=525917 RepID=A0ABY9MQR7_9GAMM|nr:tetratricopeptide repeat protein [Thiothrix lacustris]WML91000.1 tetratricopeptide repeat protein [Thiothrix lacustris]WMP17099.1 tetratricopeptide repeat protein [Thiothrix lacustris]
MSDYKTDDEKVEDLKNWWKENGTSVIAGITLAIGGMFGWQYWKDYQINTAAEASALYAKVDKASETSLEQAQPDIQTLQNNYASTPYAAIATMKAAQYYAEKGEYQPAVTALRWVIDNSKETDFKNLASIRLARVFIAMKIVDEALKLTNQTYPVAYQPLIDELKGDIYVVQNKPTEARAAYDKAMLSAGGNANELIKLKRDNLGKGS